MMSALKKINIWFSIAVHAQKYAWLKYNSTISKYSHRIFSHSPAVMNSNSLICSNKDSQKQASNATASTVTTDFMQKSLRLIFHGEIFKRIQKYLFDDLWDI